MCIDKVIGTVEKAVDSENTAKMCGMLFPYVALKKRAVDMYVEEIEKSNLSMEAKIYCLSNAKKMFKRMKNQYEIAEIAINNAVPETDFSENSKVNEEWLDRFMDSAKFVSREDVQIIWGKILAREFENPGETPPNMIRILAEITPELALTFKKVCSMTVFLSKIMNIEETSEALKTVFVPYNKNREYLSEQGIQFSQLKELETLGLLRFETVAGYVLTFSENNVLMLINDQLKIVSGYKTNQFPIGNIMLTEAGKVLSEVIPTEKMPGYYDMIAKYFEFYDLKIEDQSQYKVELSDGDIKFVKDN